MKKIGLTWLQVVDEICKANNPKKNIKAINDRFPNLFLANAQNDADDFGGYGIGGTYNGKGYGKWNNAEWGEIISSDGWKIVDDNL